MVNYTEVINDLRAEIRVIERTIAALEECKSIQTRRRRGRKFMGAAERAAVSARMKTYWEKKRCQSAATSESL